MVVHLHESGRELLAERLSRLTGTSSGLAGCGVLTAAAISPQQDVGEAITVDISGVGDRDARVVDGILFNEAVVDLGEAVGSGAAEAGTESEAGAQNEAGLAGLLC